MLVAMDSSGGEQRLISLHGTVLAWPRYNHVGNAVPPCHV